jgi:hypothetical protein
MHQILNTGIKIQLNPSNLCSKSSSCHLIVENETLNNDETGDPCSDHFVRESNYTRTFDYTLNWWESGECETRNI